MGSSRCRLFKKRLTGGVRHIHRKKRKFELARPAALTKLVTAGKRRVHSVRVRGGHLKWRALRLQEGNYAWGTEGVARKCRILDVVYNSQSNELVRTKTLVKGAIVVIDCAPFRAWYERHYGIFIGKAKSKGKKAASKEEEEKKTAAKAPSAERMRRWAKRAKTRVLEKALGVQFKTGRLLARISSRPGQTGRADGYILEGKELEFYQKKLEKKRKAK